MVATFGHDYTAEHCFFYSHVLDLQSLPTFLKRKNLFLSPQNFTVLELIACIILSVINII